MLLVALLLTFLTGFSGLVYEVTWQKCLATLLGSHSEATSAVLGIFLGGLSVGYSLFGGVARRVVESASREGRAPRLLLLYGCVEASIGIWALLFTILFRGVQAVSLAVPHLGDGPNFAVDVALTALLIGPPTVLMGATIPILTQALARQLEDATRVHAWVYAFNTTGAFVGAFSAGFFLIPRLGIEDLLRAMGGVNLAAGVGFGLLGLRPRRVVGAASAAAPHAEGFALYAAVAALLGFATMAVQTVLIRIGGLALGPSEFTFSMVVSVFVLCIAIGSFVVSALPRVPRVALPACFGALALLLALLYPELPHATYYAHVLRTFFRDQDAAFYPYYLNAFALILIVLAVPVGLSGAALPLLFDHLRRQIGDLGAVAGRLYSWNTVGNLLGALVGGYALLFWLDLHHVYRLAIAALAIAAGLVVRLTLRPPRWIVAGALALACSGLALLPPWAPDQMAAGLFRTRQAFDRTYLGPDLFYRPDRSRVVFYDDDPTSTVSVSEYRNPQGVLSGRSIVTNGKSDSSTSVDYPTMALTGLAPCILADECKRAFVIGLGTGVTASELAHLATMQDVRVAEISRGVIAARPLFDFANMHASGDPKIHVVRSDAYRALLRSDGRFDVIVSEPSNPWVAGVEMLYSQEFLRAARSRLAPGGVYGQWFHSYETNSETVELVFRTFDSVFDDVAVWFTMGTDVLLLGFERPTPLLDLARIEARAAQPDFAAGLRRGGVHDVPALLSHELMPPGIVQLLGLRGELHTLLHPRLSHEAARGFFKGQDTELPVLGRAAQTAAERSLLARYAQSRGALDESELESVAKETCKGGIERCGTALAYWARSQPDSAARMDLLERLRSSPRLRKDVSEERLARLASYFEKSAGTASGPRERSFEGAKALADLYERHFVAGLPFAPEALARIWQSCSEPIDLCAKARAEAEVRLGPLAEKR